MTFEAKVVTYTANTSTGDQDLTGTTFTPKAAIVWSTFGNNAVDTFVNGHSFGFGFTDGTDSRCYCNVSEDNQASSDCARIARNDAIIVQLNLTGTVSTTDGQASFVQWNSDGMRINWSNAPTAAFKFHVLYLGGADLTNAKVGDITISGNSTVGYTGPGFQPQMLFLVSGHTGSFNSVATDGTSFVLGTAGCTNSTINFRGSAGFVSEGARPTMDTWQLINTGAGFNSDMNATTGAFQNTSSIISLDTNGFTLTNSNYSAGSHKSYLALKGGEYFTTSSVEPGSTGTQTIEVASEMTHGCKAVMVFGCDTATAGAIQADNVFTLGAATATGEQAVTVAADLDNVADSVSTTRYETDSIYLNVTPNATATSSTVDDEATLDSLTASGFVLNWTNIGNARRFFYVAFGNSTAGFTLFDRPITEASISVSDTNARLLMANRSLAEPSISVNDTNSRLLTAFRTSAEPSISVSDANARVKIAPRPITETSISVSESLVRRLSAFRTLAESSISVSEGLVRRLSAFRTLAESAISVSDVLVRRLTANRAIPESSISVSDTVARLFTAVRTLAETSISVSDSVLGVKLAGFFTRNITEPSISVSETVTRLLTANRAISETAIPVSDALARFSLKIRSLSEPSISVSDALARIAIRVRNISESSISVSDSLSRFSLKLRSITENVIVSDTLAKIKIAFRTLSEAAISVSDTNVRRLTANRAISEATISVSDVLGRFSLKLRSITDTITVSDTLTRVKIALRALSEPSISVLDALVRRLSAFRTLAEAAITVSDTVLGESATFRTRTITEASIPVSDFIDALLTFPPLATYIVDPGYTNETRVRITFKSKIDDDLADADTGDQITYYQYDAWHPDSRPFNILNFSLRLVQGEISIATLDIEDSAENIIDRSKISFNAVVEIDFKKENGRDWTRVMTGYVRRLAVLRPAPHALMYRVTVLSKSIVYNERVTNFKRAAKRTVIDSPIPLSTDSKMHANRLFRELHTATDILPLKKPTIQKSGDFVLDTGSISDEVSDFIAEIAPGLGVAADVANSIAEVTGAIWGTDEYGNPFLRYPTEKHSGIIIKDDPQNTDSASNTSVNMDSFEFEDTIDPAEGFANRLYVLNSKDTKSTASSSRGSGSTTLTTRWIAQSFIATDNNITGAAFILSKIGNPTNTTGTIKGLLRGSSTPLGTFPTGSTLATFEISLSQLSNSADVIFVNDIKTATGVINPGIKYWWVLQGTGLNDDTKTVRWHHDNDLATAGRPPSGIGPLVDTDPTTPGTQFNWTVSTVGPVYAFSTFSSVNHILTQSDSESIKNTGTLVEAIVNLPAFDDDATFQKVLTKILQTSARVKRIFSFARVTIPTGKFFLPGELVTVVDSKARLGSEKVINAEVAEVSYNLDTNSNALGIKYADLRLIGFIDPVVDNYLENKEC